jgi:hypothetical protein
MRTKKKDNYFNDNDNEKSLLVIGYWLWVMGYGL